MKKLFLSALLATLSFNSFGDCRKILAQGSSAQKKLSEIIYGAYVFKGSTIILEEFKALSKKVNNKLDKEISITELAEAVTRVNSESKYCDAEGIKSYVVSLAYEIKLRPEILQPKPIIPYVPEENKETDLVKGSMPMRYKKRSEPILNIGLVYYGSYYSDADLERVQALLEERWNISTEQALKLNTVFRSIIPYKTNVADFTDYFQPHVSDPERLQRLWYYDNVGMSISDEVYKQVKVNEDLKGDLANIDALVIVTGAQFDALGFASGRIAVTENPMDIAWNTPGGGDVEFVTDARVVDELIHEIGHTLYLDHTANHCSVLEYNESLACCAQSPSRNDVMSYCRNRQKVDENFFNKFEACNLRILKNKIVPALLSGGKWEIEDREVCE